MARVRLLGEQDVPEEARRYLQEQQETYGTVLNSTAFAAYFPGHDGRIQGTRQRHRQGRVVRRVQETTQREGGLSDRLPLLS